MTFSWATAIVITICDDESSTQVQDTANIDDRHIKRDSDSDSDGNRQRNRPQKDRKASVHFSY